MYLCLLYIGYLSLINILFIMNFLLLKAFGRTYEAPFCELQTMEEEDVLCAASFGVEDFEYDQDGILEL